MIMIGHYSGIVKYSSNIVEFPLINRLYNSIFSTIIDESFWLQLFFVTSGFLLSYSKISNYKDLVKKVGQRFLRLYLPIVTSCLIIFTLIQVIGFYNSNTSFIFTNEWFQSSYSSSFSTIDLIVEPIRTILEGSYKFNSPYWVIKDMFYSSVLIYVVNLLSTKANTKIQLLAYLLMIVISKVFWGSIYFSCFVGTLCGLLIKRFSHIINVNYIVNKILCVVCIAFPFGLHSFIYNIISERCNAVGLVSSVIKCFEFKSGVWGTLYFALLIILINNNDNMKQILSNKIVCKLNSISFGIYSFHWPIICSVGALLMIKLPTKFGIELGWCVCVILTILLSVEYDYIFEKNINKFLAKIK